MVCKCQFSSERVVYMMLAAGYFDESTDEASNQQCFTIAGFCGLHEQTIILDLRWKDLLDKYGMPYFKASELEMGFGCFAHLRDDPQNLSKPLSQREKDLSREIKTAFIDLIVDADGLLGIGTVLMLADYERFRLEQPDKAKNLPLPYFLCAQFTMMEAGQLMWMSNKIVRDRNHPELIGNMRPVFDWQEEYSGRLKQAYDMFARRNPESARYLLPPHYEKEQDYRVLQAADCLAYEARKLLIKEEYERHRKERIAMTRMRESRIQRIYKLNYEALEKVSEEQEPDKIPIAPALEHRMRLEF